MWVFHLYIQLSEKWSKNFNRKTLFCLKEKKNKSSKDE